jgi:flagellar protein FliL
MSAAAAAPADASAEAKPKKSKKMLFIIIGVLVLALAGGGAAFFLMKKKHADEEGDGTDAAHAEEKHEAAAPPKRDPKTPPTFLPLDSMVVNLADPGGNRFVQLGITLQLDDPKLGEDMKTYMPSIRNAILLLISQRTAEQMLAVEGKEDLSQDIVAEVSAIMGFDYVDPRDDEPAEETGKSKKPKRKRMVYNPIAGVLYSSFIVQ